jgi:pyridoxamine 5'-phosphate oxidase
MTDPHALFDAWLEDAKATEPNDPGAMTLATVDADGRPAARMVLLKGHDARGFVFYTNVESRKADALAVHPHAALVFHWKSIRRQVRVEGKVTPVADAEADAYFATRARDSQLGAWASDQSRPLASREIFVQRFADQKERFLGRDVPRPPFWSGYRVVPDSIEFWTSLDFRLHERRRFVRHGDAWNEGLLYP